MSLASAFLSLYPEQRAFSPVSLQAVLAALAYGATGKQMQSLFQELNISSYEQALQLLENIKEILSGPEIRGETALFFDQTKGDIETSYYSALSPMVYMGQVDFSNPTQAASLLNQWVETNAGFSNFFSSGDLFGLILVIANALHFKDTWVNQFDPNLTQEENFTSLNGTAKSLPMMHQTKNMQYIQSSSLEAVKLSFKNGAEAIFVMGPSPNESFPENLSLKEDKVILGLPRFTIEKEIDLKPLFEKAGLSSLFEFDFARITPDLVKVDKGMQKVQVVFNEEGAEVKVVTYVGMRQTAIAPSSKPIKITFNRPFHFRIVKGEKIIVEGFYNGE